MKAKTILKRAATLAMATVMTLAMSVSAFAAGADNGTDKEISIVNAKTGHTYQAYQIFTGNLDGSTLSNIVWGSNVDTTKLTSANGFSSDVAKTVAAAITDANKDTYAQNFSKVLKGTPVATVNAPSEGKYTLSGLAQGYYLVRDASGSMDNKENDAATWFIATVTTDSVEITPKSATPTVTKTVEDINDSTSGAAIKGDLSATWGKSADYDIGDTVPFKLEATLPTNDGNGYGFADYDKYKLQFVDTAGAGLTLPTALTAYDIYFGSHKLSETEKTAVGASVTVNSQVATLTITDVKALTGTNALAAGGKVAVVYKATLNANAVVGSTGNENKVALKYSNDPNTGGEGSMGSTPESKAKVFTYKLKISKLNENNAALTGATFHLEKMNASGAYVRVASPVIIASEGNVFSVTGIDDGTYKLVEDTAPSGYSKIEDVIFTVSATHTDVDDPQLTALSASVTNGSSITSGEVTAFTCTTSTGEIAANVKDEKGITLPGTGGMGIYLFIAVAALCIGGFSVHKISEKKNALNAVEGKDA